MANYQSQHAWLIVASFPGFSGGAQSFATMGGIDNTAQTADVWDGGARTPDLLTTTAVLGSGTIERPMILTRDLSLFRFLDPHVGSLFFTIKKQPTDPNMRVRHGGVSYTCLLTGVTDPQVQAGQQSAASTLVVAFRAQKRIML